MIIPHSPQSVTLKLNQELELLREVNKLHSARGCHQLRLRQLQEAVKRAEESNPTVHEVPQALLDLFRRYPEDIPENLGNQRVGSPLNLMATRDLSAYVRKAAKAFTDPVSPTVQLTEGELSQRTADIARLFGTPL